MSQQMTKGGILLEDGSYWPGIAFGATTTKIGEFVFHTAHSGYQEILSDPSYANQVIIFSHPQLGNQGFHESDFESSKIWASGVVARDLSEAPSHWRKQKSLNETLKEFKIPGLYGVDTRRLILHLRKSGNLWGVISTEFTKEKKLKTYLQSDLSMEGLSLTKLVSTKEKYFWTQGSELLEASYVKKKSSSLKKCVVIDFGVKRQILRYLIDSGFEELTIVPAKTSAEEILSLNSDAIFLSNGPGDPAADLSIVEEVKKLIGKRPLFGICLGHQILALSLGLKTYKLKFGHHAANHPVKNKVSDRVEITSQNHGFSVEHLESNPEIEFTHFNLNDGTVEGFRHRSHPLVALQFHPEAAPGPRDSLQIFEDFHEGFRQ